MSFATCLSDRVGTVISAGFPWGDAGEPGDNVPSGERGLSGDIIGKGVCFRRLLELCLESRLAGVGPVNTILQDGQNK